MMLLRVRLTALMAPVLPSCVHVTVQCASTPTTLRGRSPCIWTRAHHVTSFGQQNISQSEACRGLLGTTTVLRTWLASPVGGWRQASPSRLLLH